ncbi:hypothetical protein ABMA28_014704 [Loxostege sticticalis]|uniref:Lipase n=1 Tax=Loxostege sticticalis TaxID=481309 RepID=A0ABD0TBZ6_LOXSC
MLRLLVLAGCVALVLGGKSPHADYVDEIFARNPSARYSTDIHEDARLDVPGLVSKYGYPIESHQVTTPDGYILTLHRIPHGRDQNNRPDPNKKVVILVHGLTSSSASFLLKKGMTSGRHTRLNPDSKINQNFWRFSWDEIGNIDLPASLTYIERVTGQTKLHYIGHSQGGTTFLVLNSLNPQFNEKFYSSHAMAPGVFFKHNDNSLNAVLSPHVSFLESAAFAMGRAEVFASREFITWFALRYCAEESIFSPICTSLIVSGTSDHFNTTMIPVFLGHAPAGASIRQFAHYALCINTDSFRRYDHGTLTNLRMYGRRTPPEYDLNKVTAPTYIYYATNDNTVHYQDVRLVASKLPNLKGAFQIESPTFNHMDFLWGTGVRNLFYTKMIRLMREAENAL